MHWVRPELVVEANYLTWTLDNLLRQVAYLGVREDKPACSGRYTSQDALIPSAKRSTLRRSRPNVMAGLVPAISGQFRDIGDGGRASFFRAPGIRASSPSTCQQILFTTKPRSGMVLI